MIKEGIKKLVNAQNLSRGEMETIFGEIMEGQATPAQISAFIVALRLKGETVDEITGAAVTMKKFATKIKVKNDCVLDTCGTGGSGKHIFNISTLCALIASGAGVTVAKHGNRSVSSKSGSADLFEKLGVNIQAAPLIVEKCINEIGIGFLFAPSFHKAMKYAIGPRREIGIRTIFNVLGPLTNPAGATHQLLGVFDKKLTQPLAEVLGNLRIRHALVVCAADGLDEVSTTGETFVCEFKNGKVHNYSVTPEQYGFKRTRLENLQISGADDSLAIAQRLLDGEAGPLQDIVLLNAAFSLYAADAAPSVEKGIEMARESVTGGKAKEKLELLKKYTNENNS